VRPVRKCQNVLISGWKRCFIQIGALCWKSLRSGALSAKITKRGDLGLKTLSYTTSCTLLKMAKNWCAQCENDKTCSSRPKNAVLYTLCTLLNIVKKWSAQCENNKTCWSQAQNLFCTISCTLLKIATKWFAQCKNDKRCWSRDENASL